ncbi:MAG: hypothetical protein STSR0001_14600 [Methanothrix sp.]
MDIWEVSPALTPFLEPLPHVGQTGLDLRRGDDIKVETIQQDQTDCIVSLRTVIGRNNSNGTINMQISYFNHQWEGTVA